MAKVLKAHDPVYLNGSKLGPTFIGDSFVLEIEVNFPGASAVKVEPDHAAYGSDMSLDLLAPLEGVINYPPRNGFLMNAQGKAVAKFGAKFVPTTAFKKMTLKRTEVAATRMDFKLYHSPSGVPNPGVCQGTSSTPAGSHTVGMRFEDGDLAFTIRSGPVCTNCMWDSSLTPLKIDHPWKVIALNFETVRTSKCSVAGDETDLRRDPPTDGTLRHNEIYVGKHPRVVLADLHQKGNQLPIMHLQLLCDRTAVNDHWIKMRWASIEIVGPDTEDPAKAFNGVIGN